MRTVETGNSSVGLARDLSLTPSKNMAMFPIRCVVETVNDGQCPQCSNAGNVLADSYAIVAGQTPLNQLVDTVLAALGLPHLSFGAKGTIQLKNWKPLTFDQISDEPDVDIESILKDVSNHLTLRILTKQSDIAVSDCLRDVKDRLLRAIVQKMPSLLTTEIPQTQLKDFILQLVQGENAQTIDAQDIHLFNSWLDEWSKKKITPISSGSSPSFAIGASSQNHANPNNAASSSSAGSSGPPMPPATRFSQLLEVPKLERWFKENANPSRQKLLHFMHVLNGSNFRKHTTKISYQQICNWFSNARASLRKRQVKNNNNHQTASSASCPVASASTNGWPSKVFGNQVRGLSLAFNDFIQSSGLSQSQPDGINNMSPKHQSGGVVVVSDLIGSSDGQSPSASSRTSGDASVTIKVEPFGDDPMAIPVENEIKINGGDATDGTAVSSCSSPTLAAISAAAKATVSHVSLMDSSPSIGAGSVGRSNVLQGNYNSLNPANRTRLMFDPLSELPMLEKYFEENPHPSWVQIDQITEALNGMLYRQTYPPVSSHNVKIWFKNRRAKCKRQVIVSDNRTGNFNDEEKMTKHSKFNLTV